VADADWGPFRQLRTYATVHAMLRDSPCIAPHVRTALGKTVLWPPE
jgi:hypothetical protein